MSGVCQEAACQDADEERECAQRFGKQSLLFLTITGKIKVVGYKSQELGKELYKNEKSIVDLVEEATSLVAS